MTRIYNCVPCGQKSVSAVPCWRLECKTVYGNYCFKVIRVKERHREGNYRKLVLSPVRPAQGKMAPQKMNGHSIYTLLYWKSDE